MGIDCSLCVVARAICNLGLSDAAAAERRRRRRVNELGQNVGEVSRGDSYPSRHGVPVLLERDRCVLLSLPFCGLQGIGGSYYGRRTRKQQGVCPLIWIEYPGLFLRRPQQELSSKLQLCAGNYSPHAPRMSASLVTKWECSLSFSAEVA